MIESLKLFFPYFPLHIQRLVSMYLKLMDFMHTFEMLQNMMNHMDEYQALFQMFEGFQVAPGFPGSSQSGSQGLTSLFGGSMPDFQSIKKMMEGSDLDDEFTYVEGSSGPGRNGS
jgi:hypothetical protein